MATTTSTWRGVRFITVSVCQFPKVQVSQQRPHFLGVEHGRLDEQRRSLAGDERGIVLHQKFDLFAGDIGHTSRDPPLRHSDRRVLLPHVATPSLKVTHHLSSKLVWRVFEETLP